MMQDDYLFDNKGSDPELERLERILSAFRYSDDRPPELPAATAVRDKPSRWRFSLSFAFAAGCTAIVVLTLWISAISRLNGPQRAFVVTEPPEVRQVPPSVVPAAKPASDPAKQIKQDVRPVFVSLRPEPVPRRGDSPARKRRAKPGTVVLTQEEKHAYGQLMLALSIAGSKLKAVHNTIQGIEDPDSSDSKNER